MRGIVSYGAYLPYWRLDRKAIAEALGVPAGSGTRAVASYDEDTTSLGVEAGRAALRGATVVPQALYFATSDPAYLDKTNATAIHAALDLPTSAFAVDIVGSVRSAVGAMRAARDARGPALAVLSDIRTGLPGGGDERDGGDGAAAFLFADDAPDARVLAEPVGGASATAEFLDRWRLPGESASRVWEERFGEHAYVPLGEAALTEALKSAGVTAPAITRLIVAGPHGRAVKRLAAAAGREEGSDRRRLHRRRSATPAPPTPGCMFADALDRAKRDDVIVVVSLADGADASVWRATGVESPPVRHRRAGRRRRARELSHVPHVARLPQARAAAPAGSAGAGGAARAPGRGVEVRVHRQPLPGVRHPSPAAAARVREVPRGRQDDARSHGRHAGHHRHVHGGPAGVLALAADGGGRARLRGRRAVPVRDDGRRSQGGEDR